LYARSSTPTTATDMTKRSLLLENFLRYVGVPSQSKGGSSVVPSTEGQRELAALLEKELRALGLKDVHLSPCSVLTGFLPSNLDHPSPKVGWVTHLDTVDVGLSPVIHPLLVKNYQGGDILQNPETGATLFSKEHPELRSYLGDDILVSDGSSVLGADDKAAVSVVMTMLQILQECPSIPHGDIYVAFVPDEEVGLLGSKNMDYSRFPVDFAYTIDCCEKGEMVYETFNAGSAWLHIQGVSAHPMASKGNLVNPSMVALDFISQFDRSETPENTEGREGFIWVDKIETGVIDGLVSMKIRDHNKAKYEEKKSKIRKAMEEVQRLHPKAKLELKFEDVYANILDAVTEENRKCIDYLYAAFQMADVEPKVIPMRGGTDGSFISTKGILVPNYFTGAHNFHSKAEFLPLSSFEKSLEVTLNLVHLCS
ncbi:MAG: peptidase T, partial [Spirochaetales bacterium]|nr:peptidase T [Candidatus Physcosoma equi]